MRLSGSTVSTPRQSDVELLQAWRSGDAKSGERLFDRHFSALNGFFRAKLAHGVEDCVQQTLLACLEGRDRIRDDGHFRAYMFGAARRVLYGVYEKRRKDETEPDFSVASLVEREPGLQTKHIAREDERLLLEGLRRLPLDYQITLELRFWQGLTGPQLAEALGVPEGTVRTRIRRGLARLKDIMATLEAGEEALESTSTRLSEWARAIHDSTDSTGSTDAD